MTVPNAMSDLVHRGADNHAEANAHVGRIAPRGQYRFEGKASGDQNGNCDEIGEKNHGGHYSAIGRRPEPPETTIRSAYSYAAAGRRQAALAASRVESLIYRDPNHQTALRSAALTYLSGVDVTADKAQAAIQTIIRRLNDALDGAARRVTASILEADDISKLRLFRQQVRELIREH